MPLQGAAPGKSTPSPTPSTDTHSVQLSSVQFSRVQLFVTPWAAACQAPLSITNSQSLLKLMSLMSVMPSNHLLLCRPLLLLPSIFPSIRVFSNDTHSVHFSSVQSLSRVRLFATPWIAVRQASLSITDSWSLLKLMSIELAMPSNHLILCHSSTRDQAQAPCSESSEP